MAKDKKPEKKVIGTGTRKVVLPNGTVLKTNWYKPPGLDSPPTNAVMGPDTFRKHVQDATRYAPKTMDEATTGRLHKDSTYDAYMRAMREAGKTPTSPKSINWGAYEKGRDYTPEDLKMIQSAEGRKVRMPNGQVLQSTWYRPPALDSNMTDAEKKRFAQRQNEMIRAHSDQVARRQRDEALAKYSNVAPDTVHAAMQAADPRRAAADRIANAIIDAGKAIRDHGNGSPQEKAAVERVHAANAAAERVIPKVKGPTRTDEQRSERTRKAKVQRTKDAIASLKAEADARSGKNPGWQDAAREASAAKRKAKAEPKPRKPGRTMAMHDGNPKKEPVHPDRLKIAGGGKQKMPQEAAKEEAQRQKYRQMASTLREAKAAEAAQPKSKYGAMAETLRQMQEKPRKPGTTMAMIEDAPKRKGKVKDLPRAEAIKRFSELMNGPPNGPWTTREINRAIRDQERTVARRAAGKDPEWTKAMAAAEQPHAITTQTPRSQAGASTNPYESVVKTADATRNPSMEKVLPKGKIDSSMTPNGPGHEMPFKDKAGEARWRADRARARGDQAQATFYDGEAKRIQGEIDAATSGKRGTQNEANLKAINANRKKNAKGDKIKTKADPSTGAGQKEAWANADRASRNRMTQYAEVQRGDNPLTPAERTKLADKRPEYEFMRPKDTKPLAAAAKSAGVTIPDMAGMKPEKPAIPGKPAVSAERADQLKRRAESLTAATDQRFNRAVGLGDLRGNVDDALYAKVTEKADRKLLQAATLEQKARAAAESAGVDVSKRRPGWTDEARKASAEVRAKDATPDKTPWEKLVAETEAAKSARIAAGGKPAQRHGVDTSAPGFKTEHQKALDVTGKRPTEYAGPVGESNLTGKSRKQLLAEAKAKGIAVSPSIDTRTLAKRVGYGGLKYMLPIGIAAGALIAMNRSAEAGESKGQQITEGAKAAGTGVAVAAGFTVGTVAAAKGLMRLGLAATPAGWAVQGALMAGGAIYGAATAAPGERLKGAAKGAWDMSLPGAIANTGVAITEAATSTSRRVSGAHLTPQQAALYTKASERFTAMQDAARAPDPKTKTSGWSNAARIAASKKRGDVHLPYGGDPNRGPEQWGPKTPTVTHAPATASGLADAMRKRA